MLESIKKVEDINPELIYKMTRDCMNSEWIKDFIQKRESIFNYSDLLNFLRKHKEELQKNEKYQKILYLCYNSLYRGRDAEIKETLDLMDEDFKKIAITNLNISIEFEKLSENEIQQIINSGTCVDNIDRVLEHLIKFY